MDKIYIDELTKINNEKYLNNYYQQYLDINSNTNFIMIDIKKFKSINDIFGHDIGDTYLYLLATTLKNNFKNSIVVRLHGDEFAIVTTHTEEEINTIFNTCHKDIITATSKGEIPREFQFNAGITKAKPNLTQTKDIADYMMYSAKKNNQTIQTFSQELYNQKQEQDNYLEKIDYHLENNLFTYTTRELYDTNKNNTNIFQLYTKSKDGETILKHNNYEYLRNTSRIYKLDMYNIKTILNNVNLPKKKLIITIDYKSLILNNEVIKYLTNISKLNKNILNNIILSIDINGIDNNYLDNLNQTINILKELGLTIRIDNYNPKVGNAIYEENNIDYIKINASYWKKEINNPKLTKIHQLRNQIFYELGVIPVYDNVTQKEEYQYLKDISKNILITGNYLSKEKRLILQKK